MARLCLLFSVIAASAVIEVGGDVAREILRLERAAISDGEAWRIVSAHFTHLGPGHLVLNLAGVLLVALLVGFQFGAGQWLLLLAASVLSVSGGLLWLKPELGWYVGLSGVLHGLLVAGLVAGLEKRRSESIALLAIVLAKLVWEQLFGALPGSAESAGGAVIVEAHLYGAIGGFVAAMLLIRTRRRAAI